MALSLPGYGESPPLEEEPTVPALVDAVERERIWADRVAIAPGFGDYQRNTSRRIPVMLLERIG